MINNATFTPNTLEILPEFCELSTLTSSLFGDNNSLSFQSIKLSAAITVKKEYLDDYSLSHDCKASILRQTRDRISVPIIHSNFDYALSRAREFDGKLYCGSTNTVRWQVEWIELLSNSTGNVYKLKRIKDELLWRMMLIQVNGVSIEDSGLSSVDLEAVRMELMDIIYVMCFRLKGHRDKGKVCQSRKMLEAQLEDLNTEV